MTDVELIEVFAREVAEALDELARLIETLHTTDEGAARERLRDVFRIAHNIKGAARAAGADEIEALTHGLEDLLGHFLEHGRPVSQMLLDQLLGAVVTMDHAANGESIASEVEALLATFAGLREFEDGPARLGEPKLSPGPAPAEPAATPDSDATPEPGGRGAASLRVDTQRLDRVMAHTGEFLAATARGRARLDGAELLVAEFRAAIASLPVAQRPRLTELLRQLELRGQAERVEQLRFAQLVDSFGEAMKRVRMFPLAALDKQWRAVLRSAADATRKRARLQLSLGGIEIDKRVLDELRDPFVHLLRNAVDHGLEDPSIRRAQGKDERGTITISASLVGAKVRIEVADDGGGLDRALISRRAVDASLATAEQLERMSDLEVYRLLFATGFSTSDQISHISGRGLGLDVVRRRIEALSGEVEIRPGRDGIGTSVRLLVPTTLVSTNGLLVRAADSVYALPLDYVARTLRVRSDSLELVDGGSALRRSEGEPLRVRWLASLLKERREVDPEQLIIVVISDGHATIGLVVAEIIGEVEFMAKRLPWNLGEIPGVSGVMTRPDGGLAIVADLPHLIAHAHHEHSSDQRALAASPRRSPKILVVDDSLTSRTLERNILIAAGYEVALSCDGEQAWQHLQTCEVDLVVTDIEMPQLDGIELTRRIRASASLGELPVILVSSLEGPEDRAAGAAAGADEYVVKGSFDQRVLLEAVARLI